MTNDATVTFQQSCPCQPGQVVTLGDKMYFITASSTYIITVRKATMLNKMRDLLSTAWMRTKWFFLDAWWDTLCFLEDVKNGEKW